MITWTNERRKLRDLIPWEHNPRQINKREAERLGDSLAEFGQIQTIAIGPDNEVYDGHQRKAVWSLLPQFGPDHEVDVRVSSRPLTEKERQKLVIYIHRGTNANWDWDELANTFEVPDLLEWGFGEWELGIIGDPQDPNELWQGMPEIGNTPKAIQSIHIHFEHRAAVEEFAELIGQSITEATRSIWYPEKMREKKSDLRFKNES